MKKTLVLLLAAAVVVLLLSGYLLLKNPAFSNLFGNSSLVRIDILKNSWAFTPEQITLKKNKTYTIQINNHDDYPHGFSVEELHINKYIPPSKTMTFELKPTISGEFTSYCSVVCGQGHFKMRGKVIILE